MMHMADVIHACFAHAITCSDTEFLPGNLLSIASFYRDHLPRQCTPETMMVEIMRNYYLRIVPDRMN